MESEYFGRLLDGERIIWSGRPRQGLLFTPSDAFFVPFSLLWCGFAIFWEFSASRTDEPVFFMLFGAVFVVVGLFFVAGRFLVDAWLRRSIRYGITNRRILIARSGLSSSFVAVALDRVPDVRLLGGAGRRGTIRFGESAPFWSNNRFNDGLGLWIPALDPTPQFLGIEDARTVFDKIQQLIPRGA